jgi:hypothetical protein
VVPSTKRRAVVHFTVSTTHWEEAVVKRTYRRGSATVTMIVLAVLALSTPTAAAAVPTNDDFDHATAITSLPFFDSVDMATATRDDDDPWWFDTSVWYAFTPTTDMTIKIQASQSDVDPVVSVWTGSRTDLQHIASWWAWGPTLRLEVTAGTTYYLMAGYNGWWSEGAIMRLAVEAAEPPLNDDFDAAIAITDFPFIVQDLDVTDATRATDDPLDWWVNQTVWYSLTSSEATYITASTAGTNYSNQLSVWTGQRANLERVDAWWGGESAVRFAAAADTTYYLMIGSYYGAADPALLNLSVDTWVPPRPLEVELTIDPTGTVNTKTGVATVSGSVSCSAAAWFSLSVDVHQRMGRFQVLGNEWAGGQCGDEGLTTWSARVRSSGSVVFGAGQATVTVSGHAISSYDEVEWEVRIDQSAPVRLSPTKG